MKKKGETAKNALRFEEILSELPEKYVREVFAEELGADAAEKHKKTARKSSARSHTAPALLRPVAACLAVLILGGLVVFSIPVVNNILTRRAPAELPGTDPVAEADTKEEETEKKEETEAPVETEEIEVSQFEKKFTFYLSIVNGDAIISVCPINRTSEEKEASFNDIFYDKNDEHRVWVASASDAQKIEIGMTIAQVVEIMGAENTNGDISSGEWALDDGKILSVTVQSCGVTDRWRAMGIWDEEANDFIEPYRSDDPEAYKDFAKMQKDFLLSQPIIEISIYENETIWNNLVERAIRAQAKYYYSQGLTPPWDK